MKKRYLLAGVTGIVAGVVATKLLTRPREISWPDSINFIYHAEHSWFTTVDGTRIHYQEAGDEAAPAILLIHGFISSTLIWDEVFLPLAAAGFRVIAPDHAEYTIESQARAVVGLMDQLGIEKAVLVGASYGGAIAAAIALDRPERVSRLVLVGAVSSDEPKKKLLLRMVRLPLVGDIVTPLFLGSRWVVRKRMADVYRRLRIPVDEHKVAARHHSLAAVDSQRAMIRTVRRWSANRIFRDAHLIRQPTMLMWGEDDVHIPLEEGFRLRDEIPNARLVVFRNCGHLPPQEYPKQFVGMVRSEPPAVAGG
ncbi:MAG: hypothetical protein DMF70_04545 [Acidobacteria bacterium]|nr:MAG: hypothetical protein DMF70_04545 [Acidobacteriota bacterium]